jgi:hypothetical protein
LLDVVGVANATAHQSFQVGEGAAEPDVSIDEICGALIWRKPANENKGWFRRWYGGTRRLKEHATDSIGDLKPVSAGANHPGGVCGVTDVPVKAAPDIPFGRGREVRAQVSYAGAPQLIAIQAMHRENPPPATESSSHRESQISLTMNQVWLDPS